MNRQEKFQERLQNPKWCEKQVKRLFSKGSKRFALFFLCNDLILHMVLPSFFSAVNTVDLDTSAGLISAFDVAAYIILIPADIMFLYILLSAIFVKYGKRWRQMELWGDRQKIFQLICREFLDKNHPPKKSIQLWTTSHFVLLAPNVLPKLYYLPLLTERIWTPKEGDVIYFSDGKKIGLTGLLADSRVMIEKAIADYF